MDQTALEGMPEPAMLRLHASDGQVLVSCGRFLVYRFEVGDLGMRNLAIVALTDADRRVDEVAAVFGLSATYVSMLRGRAAAQGSAGLVRRRGRPPKLSPRQVAKARTWAGAGVTQQVIADRLGVAQSVISELLARVGPAPVQQVLPEPAETDAGTEPETVQPSTLEPGAAEPDGEEVDGEEVGRAAFTGSARIETGTYRCRYAGAMLLFPYLDRVGAQAIFATLTGGPARRYADLGVLSTATLAFALGAGTVEGTKHLRRAEAGAALGLAATPELATLRARLSALADGSDPLRLQRAFAAAMLATDPAPERVYFVDDHFVPYAGAQPVAKGWNTKRRHAGPGRDDTLLVDARGRAVVFGTGEPSGLASTLPGVLTQLRQVIGPHAPILLGFDRGGAYPSAFTTCRDAGADWVTYRRAPLAATTATPARATITRAGIQVQVMLADEAVQIKGYGPARQLTLFEDDAPVLQVLTATPPPPQRACCPGCGPAGGSRTCSSTPPNTTASTRWLTTPWTSARIPQGHQPRPDRGPQNRCGRRGRARRRRTSTTAAASRSGDPQTEERRPAKGAPPDRDRCRRTRTRQVRATPRTGQGRSH